MTTPHAQRLPPHPLLLGLTAGTLLLAGVGVVVWWQDGTPPGAQAGSVMPRPGAELATPDPEPPSALWDAERAEQLVVKELLKERAR